MMPHLVRRAFAAVAALATLSAAGCSSEGPKDGDRDTGPLTVRLYGSDGNMTNSFGGSFVDRPELLRGMTGTAPLTPVGEDFKRRLRTIDPALADFTYTGEAYDAVVAAALAAETARTTEGAQIARYITAVTVSRDPNGTCETFRTCLAAVRAGKDIAYRGIALRHGLTDKGEPSAATYGALMFGHHGQIDDSRTEYLSAGDERTAASDPAAPPPPPAKARPVPALKVAALLPRTGDLALSGPPMFTAVQLAVREVNEAGGVLGQPVQYLDGDDGTDPRVAAATADRHIAAGAQVIIGAAASGVTRAVLPKVVAAQRVLFSPSATSDELSGVDDKGMFFRTAPPDALQAKALGYVITRFGARRVVLIARDDSYGTGLRDQVAEQLRAAGVSADRVKALTYRVGTAQKGDDFVALARDTSQFRPDAVLVIGFAESALVIKALAAQGVNFRT